MDAHELVAALKQLALELGRVPNRAEFEAYGKGFKYQLGKHFGNNYTTFLQAAGLPTYDARRGKGGRKLDNSIFERDIAEQLENYQPKDSKQFQGYKRTLFIPDTHFPFASRRVLDAIYAWAEEHKPERVIQLGDLYDLYSHSKFPRSQNLIAPKDEERTGREQAEEMWKRIRSIVPAAECVQIVGNHDLRPLKQTLAHLPSLEHVIEKYLHELMTFEGVTLISDARQEYEFDDVQVFHGYRSGLGAHITHTLTNTVHGHDHKLGVAFKRIRGKTIWELHCGLAGEPEAKVFHYTPQKSTQEMPGFGWLDSHGPRAIPV